MSINVTGPDSVVEKLKVIKECKVEKKEEREEEKEEEVMKTVVLMIVKCFTCF